MDAVLGSGEWVGEWTGGDTPFYYYGEREDRERTQWLAGNSGDGFLVWDHNKDGRITDASELMSEFAKDGSVAGNSSGRDNLFRVNLNATTGNVVIPAANNASVTGPLTIANGTTLTITSTGRLAII